MSEPARVLRALVVSPTPTWPLDYGNRKRVYRVCRDLERRGFEIHFVHYASEADWRDHVPVGTRARMQAQWDMVDHVMPSIPLHDCPKNGEDHGIDEWWDPALENHLKCLLRAREYDLILVNYTWLSRALELAPKGVFRVLDTHDKFSGRASLLESHGIKREFFHTTEDQEVTALDRADLVWAIKHEEEEAFRAMGTRAEVRTLLHVDEPRRSASPNLDDGIVFGFVGANNRVNLTNLCRFIEVAEPVFRRYCAPLRVRIAGSVCDGLAALDSPFFTCEGYVDSIDDFYDRVHAAIVPMEFSTGLKIKVAEALSQGKPTLAHRHAMEGFPALHPLHRLEDFESLARAMVELAYETADLDALGRASVTAFERTLAEIDEGMEYLSRKVVERKRALVLLPDEYGDPSRLHHWLATARLDLLSWSLDNFMQFRIGPQTSTRANCRALRFAEPAALASLLGQTEFDVVLNLHERLPPIEGLERAHLVSAFPIDWLSERDYLRYDLIDTHEDAALFPALGHVRPTLPELERRAESQFWVIGDCAENHLAAYVRLLAGEAQQVNASPRVVRDVELLLREAGGLPTSLIVTRPKRDLCYAEQLLVELCLQGEVPVRYASRSQLVRIGAPPPATDYTNLFFPAWQNFMERHVLSSGSAPLF